MPTMLPQLSRKDKADRQERHMCRDAAVAHSQCEYGKIEERCSDSNPAVFQKCGGVRTGPRSGCRCKHRYRAVAVLMRRLSDTAPSQPFAPGWHTMTAASSLQRPAGDAAGGYAPTEQRDRHERQISLDREKEAGNVTVAAAADEHAIETAPRPLVRVERRVCTATTTTAAAVWYTVARAASFRLRKVDTEACVAANEGVQKTEMVALHIKRGASAAIAAAATATLATTAAATRAVGVLLMREVAMHSNDEHCLKENYCRKSVSRRLTPRNISRTVHPFCWVLGCLLLLCAPAPQQKSPGASPPFFYNAVQRANRSAQSTCGDELQDSSSTIKRETVDICSSETKGEGDRGNDVRACNSNSTGNDSGAHTSCAIGKRRNGGETQTTRNDQVSQQPSERHTSHCHTRTNEQTKRPAVTRGVDRAKVDSLAAADAVPCILTAVVGHQRHRGNGRYSFAFPAALPAAASRESSKNSTEQSERQTAQQEEDVQSQLHRGQQQALEKQGIDEEGREEDEGKPGHKPMQEEANVTDGTLLLHAAPSLRMEQQEPGEQRQRQSYYVVNPSTHVPLYVDLHAFALSPPKCECKEQQGAAAESKQPELVHSLPADSSATLAAAVPASALAAHVAVARSASASASPRTDTNLAYVLELHTSEGALGTDTEFPVQRKFNEAALRQEKSRQERVARAQQTNSSSVPDERVVSTIASTPQHAAASQDIPRLGRTVASETRLSWQQQQQHSTPPGVKAATTPVSEVGAVDVAPSPPFLPQFSTWFSPAVRRHRSVSSAAPTAAADASSAFGIHVPNAPAIASERGVSRRSEDSFPDYNATSYAAAAVAESVRITPNAAAGPPPRGEAMLQIISVDWMALSNVYRKPQFQHVAASSHQESSFPVGGARAAAGAGRKAHANIPAASLAMLDAASPHTSVHHALAASPISSAEEKVSYLHRRESSSECNNIKDCSSNSVVSTHQQEPQQSPPSTRPPHRKSSKGILCSEKYTCLNSSSCGKHENAAAAAAAAPGDSAASRTISPTTKQATTLLERPPPYPSSPISEDNSPAAAAALPVGDVRQSWVAAAFAAAVRAMESASAAETAATQQAPLTSGNTNDENSTTGRHLHRQSHDLEMEGRERQQEPQEGGADRLRLLHQPPAKRGTVALLRRATKQQRLDAKERLHQRSTSQGKHQNQRNALLLAQGGAQETTSEAVDQSAMAGGEQETQSRKYLPADEQQRVMLIEHGVDALVPVVLVPAAAHLQRQLRAELDLQLKQQQEVDEGRPSRYMRGQETRPKDSLDTQNTQEMNRSSIIGAHTPVSALLEVLVPFEQTAAAAAWLRQVLLGPGAVARRWEQAALAAAASSSIFTPTSTQAAFTSSADASAAAFSMETCVDEGPARKLREAVRISGVCGQQQREQLTTESSPEEALQQRRADVSRINQPDQKELLRVFPRDQNDLGSKQQQGHPSSQQQHHIYKREKGIAARSNANTAASLRLPVLVFEIPLHAVVSVALPQSPQVQQRQHVFSPLESGSRRSAAASIVFDDSGEDVAVEPDRLPYAEVDQLSDAFAPHLSALNALEERRGTVTGDRLSKTQGRSPEEGAPPDTNEWAEARAYAARVRGWSATGDGKEDRAEKQSSSEREAVEQRSQVSSESGAGDMRGLLQGGLHLNQQDHSSQLLPGFVQESLSYPKGEPVLSFIRTSAAGTVAILHSSNTRARDWEHANMQRRSQGEDMALRRPLKAATRLERASNQQQPVRQRSAAAHRGEQPVLHDDHYQQQKLPPQHHPGKNGSYNIISAFFHPSGTSPNSAKDSSSADHSTGIGDDVDRFAGDSVGGFMMAEIFLPAFVLRCTLLHPAEEACSALPVSESAAPAVHLSDAAAAETYASRATEQGLPFTSVKQGAFDEVDRSMESAFSEGAAGAILANRKDVTGISGASACLTVHKAVPYRTRSTALTFVTGRDGNISAHDKQRRISRAEVATVATAAEVASVDLINRPTSAGVGNSFDGPAFQENKSLLLYKAPASSTPRQPVLLLPRRRKDALSAANNSAAYGLTCCSTTAHPFLSLAESAAKLNVTQQAPIHSAEGKRRTENCRCCCTYVPLVPIPDDILSEFSRSHSS